MNTPTHRLSVSLAAYLPCVSALDVYYNVCVIAARQTTNKRTTAFKYSCISVPLIWL